MRNCLWWWRILFKQVSATKVLFWGAPLPKPPDRSDYVWTNLSWNCLNMRHCRQQKAESSSTILACNILYFLYKTNLHMRATRERERERERERSERGGGARERERERKREKREREPFPDVTYRRARRALSFPRWRGLVNKKCSSLVRRKFWVLSWSDPHGSLGVEWYRSVHC